MVVILSSERGRNIIFTYQGFLRCNFLWFISPTWMHSSSYIGYGCHMPSKIWDGENRCFCAVNFATNWNGCWASCCTCSLSHEGVSLSGTFNYLTMFQLNEGNKFVIFNPLYWWFCSVSRWLWGFSSILHSQSFWDSHSLLLSRFVTSLRGSVSICQISRLQSFMVASTSESTRSCWRMNAPILLLAHLAEFWLWQGTRTFL